MSIKIDVLIPNKTGDCPMTTVESLYQQSYQDFNIIIANDEGKGQNYARNEAFQRSTAEWVLTSDNDIQWYPDGIQNLADALDNHPEASYSYGAYQLGKEIKCHQDFSARSLRKLNFISSMALIRRDALWDRPFDEDVNRYTDWHMWLTLLDQGKVGVFCGEIVFKTAIRDGMTFLNGKRKRTPNYRKVIMSKHLKQM